MEQQSNQLANIGCLHRFRYFWGTMTREEAKSVIVNYPPRSYIMTYNPDVEQFELHFKVVMHLGVKSRVRVSLPRVRVFFARFRVSKNE